jgi:diguanylate cyclase (GGDEF)-like protein/PAS domain S-box-containing protein
MPADNQTKRLYFMCMFFVQSLALLVLLFPLHSLAAQAMTDKSNISKVVKIGVLAHRGSTEAFRTWTPLAKYLNNKIEDYRFHIVPLNIAETREMVANHSIDFLLTNPGNFIDLENRFALQALATLKKKYDNNDLNAFGAVIFTRADKQGVNALADLKHRSFMGVKPGAFGGFQMAWGEFKNNRIDPFTELSELQFSGFPQSAVVVAVRNGWVDAGTVRTGILESMADKGLVDLKDFRILNAQNKPDFPLLLSTQLYPEWPIAHLANTSPDLIGAVYEALLAMPDDIIQSGRTRVTGWNPPSDYQPVHTLMQQLQVGAYKDASVFTPVLFIKKYLGWVLLVFALLALMVLFTLYTLFLNRRILSGKHDLERKVQEGIVLEQSLQRERNFLKALLDNISEGVVACDNNGNITSYNQAMLSICGLGSTDIKGNQWHELFDFYQGDGRTPLKSDANPFAQVLSGHSIIDYEMGVNREDGYRHLLVSGQSIIDNQGSEVGAVLSLHDVTERIVNEHRLRKSERELRAILDSMQDTYYRTDVNGKVLRTSSSIIDMLGYTTEESIGVDLPSLYVEPGGRAKFLKTLEENGGEIQNYQMPMWHKDGHAIWVSTSAHFHYDRDGNIDGVEGVTRDITELKNAEAQLFKEKEKAHITLQSIGDGVITMDVKGNIEYLNPYAEQMVGCSSDSAINRPLASLLHFSDAASKVPLEDPVSMCLEEEQIFVFNEHVHAIRNDGTRFAVKLTVSPMRDLQGQIQGVVMVMHDVSEMWKMAQQLSYQASHDALTGLINRREFDQQLSQALERCRKTDRQHTLCYMDLDQFKIVNDTCGHIAGDRLLKQLSQVLVSDVRDNDIFARLGGDEFGLLLEGCSLDKAEAIVEKIRKTVKEFRFTWEDKNFELGASIGMVPVDRDSVSVTELLSEADAACYVAKDLGRNRIHKYQQGDSDLVKHKSEMQWVNRIQQALEEGRFISYCQSIQPLQCGDDLYAEILIRMLDENGDIVLPGAFIPAAERYHLMSDIDRWVIRDVFARLQNQQSNEQQNYTINLSGQSVGDDKILQFIIDCLHEYGIDASSICFEITETAAVANLDSARVFIAQLHELGCKFALDDFGSGLSSFAYLKNLDVDFLKIDGSFVHDIDNDPVDYAMVASINRIGHLMGIKTIAEFVEDRVILQRLKEIGVDYVQGYNIDMPRPLSEMAAGKIARI